MWALLFPGQGSQHVGMGRIFYENFSEAKHTLEEASDTLSINFKKLLFDGPESDLALTENTQPALLLASTMMVRSLSGRQHWPFQAAAGHSLGEYSALVATGALRFEDAIRAVRTRGLAMQEAVPVGQGGMLAVLGVSDEIVEKICAWVCAEAKDLGTVEPANFNAPGQVVISGAQAALTWLRENYSAEKVGHEGKAKFIPLNVSAPFHCSMMKPAQLKMQALLEKTEFRVAQIPVVQNVNAKPVTQPLELRLNLTEQISSPVRWSQSVRELKALGHTRFVEMGPGKVLSGLVKKIDSELPPTLNMQTLEDIQIFEKETSV